ncbi:hypothetical protein [Acidovorax sp. RAC01]|uniref:hypothetical protein n=1 Tax=Acidovorax sp. RAC01 TaxID=1842533 RepID=UPI0008566895|nr:hypothetical protein [Acidovorax sp. RAC01]AOG22575.1 hypothetical protein BSY15_3017 [Acidovorax sp. RAC01]
MLPVTPSHQAPCSPARRLFLHTALRTAVVAPAAIPLLARGASWPPAGASDNAQRIVRWTTGTRDHQGLPFVVVDKPRASIHVFSAAAQWLASAPVLLGSARGDRSAPDIGNRPLSQIRPEERTTPAGRFATEPGRNLRGDDIVWIDYDTAVSLHRLRSVNAAERRQQRLASATTADRRISYGCINTAEAFYNAYIAPLLGAGPGVAYVLPDTEPFATFFVAASAYP